MFAGLQINFDDDKNHKKKGLIFNFFETNNFFKDSLKKNPDANKYINSRIKKIEVISNFEIGYCPTDQELTIFLNEKGYDMDEIKKTDLINQNNDNKFFGRFRNRLIFPIFNFSDKVVGFGGREIQNNSKIKYINSQESEIFKKSEILFGLKQNKKI